MDQKQPGALRPIRILIADDHPVVREGLVAILMTRPDFVVVAEAGTGLEAVQKTLAYRPDILLLDLEMPELDGVEVLRRLNEANLRTRTIIFTAYDTDERILSAVKQGIQGYLLKGTPREKIFQAIRIVAAGGSLLEPAITLKLFHQVSGEARRESPDRLSGREMEVLRCLSQGMANKEIALKLVISERTVKFHVSAILAKLNAGNRTEAVKKAVQQKIIQL